MANSMAGEVTESEREFSNSFGDKYGTFSIRIPLPFEKVQIVAATSRFLNGATLESIRSDDYEYARMIVTLNHVLFEQPKWWTGADNCPDDNFLLKLWKLYRESEEKFENFLKKNS